MTTQEKLAAALKEITYHVDMLRHAEQNGEFSGQELKSLLGNVYQSEAEICNEALQAYEAEKQSGVIPCVCCGKQSDTATPDDADMCFECFGSFNATNYDNLKKSTDALVKALEFYAEEKHIVFSSWVESCPEPEGTQWKSCGGEDATLYVEDGERARRAISNHAKEK